LIFFQFTRLAHLLTLSWAVALAVYWLIASALLADLYRRYCGEDDGGFDCGNTEEKFFVLPLFGFICMAAWVSGRYMYVIHIHTYRKGI